jgi:hypothetical protein
MNGPDIELNIDELVLDGFDSLDGSEVKLAVESALSRLLAERGVPPSLASGGLIPSAAGREFDVPSGSDASAIGGHIAEAIYGGMSQ